MSHVHDPKEIGLRIRAAREAAGLTQEELAARSDVERSYVSLLEAGARSATGETLARISAALGVAELLEGAVCPTCGGALRERRRPERAPRRPPRSRRKASRPRPICMLCKNKPSVRGKRHCRRCLEQVNRRSTGLSAQWEGF